MRKDSARYKVFWYLLLQDEPKTPKDIEDETGVKGGTLRPILKMFHDAGLIYTPQETKKGYLINLKICVGALLLALREDVIKKEGVA